MNSLFSPPKNHSLYIRAWTIFIACALFYFYKSLLQVSPDGMGAALQHEFAVDDQRLGRLSAAFFLTCTLMQLPAGILLDQFGSRKLLTVACTISAISSLFFAFAPHFAVATLARLMMGLASAFVFVGSLKLIAEWFPSQRFSFLNGFFSTIGMLGAISGEAPLVRLIAMTGWRHSMLLLSIFGFILALFIFLVVKNKPIDTMAIAKPLKKTLIKNLLCVLKNKQAWLISIYMGIITIPYTVLCNLYGIPFFTTAYAIDPLTAAYLVSLILLGIGIGSPVWGAVSDYTKRRLPFLFIAAIVPPILLIFIIYYSFSNLLLLKIALFSLGFFTGAALPAFAIIRDINKSTHVATALAMINMTILLSNSIALPLLGHFLDDFRSKSTVSGMAVYSLHDYKVSFSFILILLAIPLALLFLAKSKNKKIHP